MASTSELRRRIAGVRQTQKITRAMYLISSAKMRRAREELEHTRPYFDALRSEIERIFRVDGSVSSRFFSSEDAQRSDPVCGCLVITADKGLAGAYNHNILKAAQSFLSAHPRARLYVAGEYGRRWFERRGIEIEHSFLYTAQNPNLFRAREIAQTLLADYERARLDEIDIIYTDLSGMTQCVRQSRLLPLPRQHFCSGTPKAGPHFEFAPSLSDVLEGVVKSYLSGYIYSALVDSFCSEQSARMAAMDAANQNAEELLGELSRRFSRARQGAITQEITEISAGARAQKSHSLTEVKRA